jgi:hypothetical protein
MAEASTDFPAGRHLEDAALWQVDLADISRQTDVPTEVLLDALISSTAQDVEHMPPAAAGALPSMLAMVANPQATGPRRA